MNKHVEAEWRFPAKTAWAIFAAMIFGNFMAILDIQIVASSLNEVQAGMSASRYEVTWVQTVYLIAEIIAIPMSSIVSRVLLTRVYYTMCAIGFTVSSLLCALSWNLESLLVFRGIQGFMGGGMIPTSMTALYLLFPEPKRSLPLVMFGMISTLGPAIGPTIGGWLTNNFSWHWMFLINIIPGIIIATVIYSGPNIDHANYSLIKSMDWFSLVGMAMFLGGLEYFLDEGARHDWLADTGVRIAFMVCVVGGMIFFSRSFTQPKPLLDLSVFKNKNFTLSAITTFVIGMALYGLGYMIPVFLGQVREMNSSQIGHVMMVTGIVMFCFAPFLAWLIPNFDTRKTVFVGMILAGFGVWLNSHLSIHSDYDFMFWPQIYRGIGLMICLIVVSHLAMSTLPLSKVADASGIYNLMRNIGGAVGLALINSSLDWLTAMHVTQINQSMTPQNWIFTERLDQLTAQYQEVGTNAQQIALSVIYRDIHFQALTSSFNDLLRMLAIIMFVTAFLTIFMDRGKKMNM
ncbi:DHA2 family efflux MFS transporter permease subunit [Acinetobacter baumannii]|nr:DHA2 family efflux MFS transporter permease subunit [Acinetobacter baumannii]EHU2752418.1 DHA2 family efflux MFS transporter permease subunit [Acinetobacter baumannii]HCH8093615.1 DHA2 family efflux MFS transporter permease subunit [Acinetobacter baumannii]